MDKIIEIFSNNESRPYDKIIRLLTENQIRTLQDEFNHSDARACLYALKQRLSGFEISLRCPICNKEIQRKQYSRLHSRQGFSERSCGTKECKNLYKEKCVFEKYGVTSVRKLDSVKEKCRKTCLEKYGVDHPNKTKEVRDKIKRTTLERYGVENYRNSNEYLEKANKTCQERYGLDLNEISSQEWVRDKVKQTCLEKFGTESPLQNEDIKNKMKQTNLEKYGVEWHTQIPGFQEYVKLANLEKYGVEYTIQSPEIKEKIKRDNLEKYGVEWYFQQDEFKNKYRNYFLELYGVQNPMKIKEISKRARETAIKRYGCFPVPQKVYINSQKLEHEVFEFIENQGTKFSIIRNDRKILNGKELDVYIPEIKLAIEFNGDYWHSDVYKVSKYHLNKTLIAESKGIRLIHIWEHEWLSKQEFIKTLITLYLENKVYQNEFQKLLEPFNGRLPRDYFQTLDFAGKIEEPKEEIINDNVIEKTGYILNNEK